MRATICSHTPIMADSPSSSTLLLSSPRPPCFSRKIHFSRRRPHPCLVLDFSVFPGSADSHEWCNWKGSNSNRLNCRAIDGGRGGGGGSRRVQTASSTSIDDDKPYEVLPGGKISFLDEQDVVTFLDPPKLLIPLDPSSFNPAAYLWKKIEDIPEERRHRLLSLLKPRLISRAWEIAGARYEDSKLAKKTASNILSDGNGVQLPEFWKCRTSGGPVPLLWINFFKKALFCCKDGKTYGRFIGGSLLGGILSSFYPMYFSVAQINEVMATEQPCDLAYEFGDGLLDLPDHPDSFPKPGKHPWPFNDQVVIYIRHVGPGIMVGQAWQEGQALQQVPKRLCNEILMVKDYFAYGKGF